MLLTLLLALGASPEVPRPDGAVAKPAAQVVMQVGEVTITGKKTFPAKLGMWLQASDKVKVPPNAWVVLSLVANDHVVRLDDDLELEVGQLALFGAPKATRDRLEQLDLLVTKKEQAGVERLIGWNATLAGASTPTVRSEPQSPPMPPPPGASGNSQPRPEPQPVKASKAKLESNRKTESEPIVVRPSDESKAKEAVAKPPSAGGSSTDGAGGPPPRPSRAAEDKRTTVTFESDAELASCIDESFTTWGPGLRASLGPKLHVEARWVDEELRVRLPRALTPTACVTAWVRVHGAAVGKTWTTLDVPLSPKAK